MCMCMCMCMCVVREGVLLPFGAVFVTRVLCWRSLPPGGGGSGVCAPAICPQRQQEAGAAASTAAGALLSGFQRHPVYVNTCVGLYSEQSALLPTKWLQVCCALMIALMGNAELSVSV
jgi:hypothetical protein